MKMISTIMQFILKVPIYVYRYTISPFTARSCRHSPTCSSYSLEAIETNGAWKGIWLSISRILRCQPWGTNGYDPVPDLKDVHYPFWRAWKYGRWNGKHIKYKMYEKDSGN